jgi:hypothetical protein
MANGFRDSTDNMSYMAGAGLHRRLYETDKLAGFYVYAGLNAFVMSRQDTGGDPFPGILPSVSVGNDKFGHELPRRRSHAQWHPVPAVQGQPRPVDALALEIWHGAPYS